MSSNRTMEWVSVANLTNGSELRVAIHTITGKQPGPTVGLVGAVHGDEPIGTAIVLRSLEEFEERLEAGRILALPVANPLALEAISRNTPHDQLNLNRVFPGARDGLLTEQIAFVLAKRFIPQCNVILDFHAAGHHGHVDYVIAGTDEELGLAFGRRHVYVGPSFPGTLTGHATRNDVRTIAPELGGVAMDDESSLTGGLGGILNVLRYLEMVPGDVEYPAEQIIFTRKLVLKPQKGGILHPVLGRQAIGAEVPQGTVLASVTSPLTGEVIEEIRAPFGRNLLIHVRAVAAPIVPGMYAYQAADLEDARVVRR